MRQLHSTVVLIVIMLYTVACNRPHQLQALPNQKGDFGIIAPNDLSKVAIVSADLERQIRFSTVRVISNIESGETKSCTGVLIASNWVLTAAHCVKNAPMVIQLPELGSQDIKTKLYRLKDPKLQIEVSKTFVHPLYSFSNGDAAFDLGLLKLSRSVSAPYMASGFNESVLDLPKEVVIAGFGDTQENEPVNPSSVLNFYLRKIEPSLEKLENDKYRENYKTRNQFPIWTWDQSDRSLPRICHGDSGGPLFEVQGQDLKVIGINSGYDGESGHCIGNALVTNIEYSRKFIDEVIRTESLPKLEEVAEVEALPGVGGLWKYASDKSIFLSSSAEFEVYFAQNTEAACLLPRPMRALHDERKFLSLHVEEGEELFITTEHQAKIEWQDQAARKLQFVQQPKQFAIARFQGDVLSRLTFLPEGPRLTNLSIVRCENNGQTLSQN